MAYDYPKLSTHQVRVLELQPSDSWDEPISCHLTIQLIEDRPYEALSYVWGKADIYTAQIRCQDNEDASTAGPLTIGANLATALKAYRLPHTARRLWVDAICIKQQDVLERQSQVRMMGSIFRNASQVLCWLGAFQNPSVDEQVARVAITTLLQFNNDPNGELKQIQSLIHRGERTANQADAELTRAWHAIKTFFDLEYFHRAWIIQEIGLAQLAVMSWGRSDIQILWKDVARFVLFLDDNGASVINHLSLKSWVCNHVNLVWSNDPLGKPIYDFVEVLHWARVHLSTDARDYVYSLLGHPSAIIEDVPLIEPRYTISTEEVYTDLAKNVIQRTDRLHILAFVDHDENQHLLDLPSWVPDWHALNLVAPLRYPTFAAAKEFDAIKIHSAATPNMTLLEIEGYLIDSIVAYTSIVNPNELTITTREAEDQKTTPFLIDHIYEKLVLDIESTPAPSTEDFMNAVCSMLTGAHRENSPAASDDRLYLQRADFAAYVLEYNKLRPTNETSSFYATFSDQDKQTVQNLASSGSAEQYVQDMTWTSMCRRVFRTSNGSIGLGPRIMSKDDIVIVTKGSKYPLVLREVNRQYRLVGGGLLYGFMDGEAERLAQAGKFTLQTFILY
ncbi:hypothetical protein VHEMI06814 [[Torrubiella] hemipterigena]|uniref:Heterokaryon incompatibility domain-containing protein n=1 Tax=[Torrubiella] hemipterigena TaxID=1531966 RepID=A0A0A1T1M7_9HYPO|nr:hypothetical protein VHEMI06814 [[Torrubiella] hemipterigena]